MEGWGNIRRLAAEAIPIARIAERLEISRMTVVKAVRSSNPPDYGRASTTSFVSFDTKLYVSITNFVHCVDSEDICEQGTRKTLGSGANVSVRTS